MATKLVLDTSVVISALIGRRGPSREVIRKCLEGAYSPLISNALFQEYEDVSKRTQVLSKCPLSQAEINELLHAFNFLIELAIAGNAATIVTNNIKDLENAELSFPQLRIMKPEQLLRGE